MDGVTPTHAGKTTPSQTARRFSRDHPRACGENQYCLGAYALLLGSPPRTRGKLHDTGIIRKRSGITPACAGKTCLPHLASADTVKRPSAAACASSAATFFLYVSSRDLKRARFESRPGFHVPFFIALATIAASSSQHCITNSSLLALNSSTVISRPSYSQGSPPRVWGKLRYLLLRRSPGGITPAHAGKTPPVCASVPRRADHPRACGENF